MKDKKFYQLVELVPDSIVQTKTDLGQISDGYHTFDELYHYRALYNAAFFNEHYHYQGTKTHKSRKHSDGKFCFDADGEWFVVMTELPTGQISNHYHSDYWDLFRVPEQETADVLDGHTPKEAAERLEAFLRGDWAKPNVDE